MYNCIFSLLKFKQREDLTMQQRLRPELVKSFQSC